MKQLFAHAGQCEGFWWLVRVGFVLVVAAFLFHAGSYPIGWGDFFWQLKTGELVWNSRAVPHIDSLAWTTRGKEWVEHEWLSGLLDYALYRSGGLLAVRLFFAALWLVGSAHLASVLLRVGRGPLPALLSISALLVLMQRQFIPAPSTLSLFVFFWLSLLVAPWLPRRSGLRITASTGLFYLWCNLHSIALLSLGFLALYALLPTVQRLLAHLTSSQFRERAITDRHWLFASCLAVSFLTPYTYKIHLYALRGPDIARLIDEWVPLLEGDYVNATAKGLVVLIAALTTASITVRLRHGGWRGFLLGEALYFDLCALSCLYLSLRHGRFVWLDMVPLVWLMHLHADGLRARPLFSAAAVASSLVLAMFTYGWSPALLPSVASRTYYRHNLRDAVLPVGAANYLLSHHLEGRLFNHYIWGGYLIFRLAPRYRVFVDGRTVLHGTDIIIDEMRISNGSPETPALLDRYGIQIMVVSPYFLSPETARQLGWTIMYRDAGSSVLYRPVVPRGHR